MASKSSQSGTSSVEDGLKEIIQSNKDILELLDKIEAQKKQQSEIGIKPTNKKRQDKTSEESPNIPVEQVSDGYRDNIEGNIDTNLDKDGNNRSDVNNNGTKTSETELSTGVYDNWIIKEKSQTVKASYKRKEHGKGIEEQRLAVDPKHRQNNLGNLSIIKGKTVKIEGQPGFVERIKLSEEQEVFSSTIRARKTLIQQDNRICDHFGLPLINEGYVYESIEKPSSVENPISAGSHVVKVDRKRVDLDRKKRQEEHAKSNSHNRSSVDQIDQKQAPKSILKKTTSSSNPKSILKKPDSARKHAKARTSDDKSVVVRDSRTVARPEKSDVSKDLEKSNNSQQDLIQFIQATDVSTDQGKTILKMQAHMLRTQAVTLMPEKKIALHTWADMMDKMAGANENIQNPEFWSKLSDDMNEEQKVALLEYLEEMQSMFFDHLQLDQNLKGFFKGSLSLMKAVAEGNFFEKCMTTAEYVEKHPEEFSDKSSAHINIMKTFGEMADSESTHQPRASTDDKRTEPLAITDGQNIELEPVAVLAAEKTEKVEDKAVEERVTINEGLWAEYANDEVKKGQIAKDIREKGMDTIFCLDVSQSMKGGPLRQAKTFIKGFVEGIQNTNHGNDVFEHVSLVTFGSETKVQQHLTCDYFELLRKLDRLQPGGPTPMFAGLTMIWAAILGAGTVFTSNGYKIYPRVYVLSDGKMTPASIIAGPDSCTQEETTIEQEKVMKHASHLHKEYHLTIHAVPLGDFDMNTLESITKDTGGKIIAPEDWKSECKTFRNYLKACSIGQSSQLHKLMVDVLHVDTEDQAQIDEFLKTHKREGGNQDSNDEPAGFENEVFPPLGSRVKKKHGSLCGTVTKHFKDGIGVTWDRVDTTGSLRVKFTDLDEVEQANEPRILKDELIALGCRVKRGKDWTYGDQDGKPGNEGSVFDVQPQGLVAVRWDHDGSKAVYKYGLDGRFDLEIVQLDRNSSPTPNIIEKRNEINIEELNRRNKQNSDKESNKEYKWAWQGIDGTWRMFPETISKTIETSFKRNPRGTVLITVEDKQYRIVFSRMEQVDINSKAKFSVSRS